MILFTSYKQISSSSITLVPKKAKELIKGYDKTKNVTIAEKDITVYYKEESDNIVLIYGINTISGEESWYYYDTKDGAMLKYTDTSTTVEETHESKDNNKNYRILLLVLFCVSGLALLFIISLVLYVIKLKNKNEELFKYMEKRITKHRDKKFNSFVDKEIEKSDLESFEEDIEPVIEEEVITEDVVADGVEKEEVAETTKEPKAENAEEEKEAPKEDSVENLNVPEKGIYMAFIGETWVEVKDKNKVYVQKVFHNGDERTLEYRKNLFISVGRPQNIKLYVNGVEKDVLAKNRKSNIPLDSI